MIKRWTIAVALLAVIASQPRADDKLADIACRSVHLAYSSSGATAFTTEMTPTSSAEGTYFMACGFSLGYFGIQELDRGKKVLIFSIWDPGDQNNPNAVAADQRVKLLAKGPSTRVKRFGGEGTGGQSFVDLDWKLGQTYRFLVKASPDGDVRTAVAAYFQEPGDGGWTHVATFSTLTKTKRLTGLYSFIEDFRRDRVSLTKPLRATFGNAWVVDAEGKPRPLTKARFTADSNPALNIDAGVEGANFFLGTGGEIKNEHTPLRGLMERKPSPAPPSLEVPNADDPIEVR